MILKSFQGREEFPGFGSLRSNVSSTPSNLSAKNPDRGFRREEARDQFTLHLHANSKQISFLAHSDSLLRSFLRTERHLIVKAPPVYHETGTCSLAGL